MKPHHAQEDALYFAPLVLGGVSHPASQLPCRDGDPWGDLRVAEVPWGMMSCGKGGVLSAPTCGGAHKDPPGLTPWSPKYRSLGKQLIAGSEPDGEDTMATQPIFSLLFFTSCPTLNSTSGGSKSRGR